MPKNQTIFLNTRGEVRNFQGQVIANVNKPLEFQNALGALQTTSTLLTILADVIKQKFFTIDIAKYVPVVIGEGNPWANELMQWKTAINGDDFESGFINLGSNNSQSPSDNISVEPIKRSVIGWKKNISYNIFEENTFNAGTQNMDLIASRYEARKELFDLGIQKTAILGSVSDPNVLGLLTQSDVNSNTTLITEPLHGMSADELNTFLGAVIPAYRTNCNYTAYPNRFYIPENDFNGLGNQMSTTFPLRSKLDVLKTTLAELTMNPNFEILPLAYATQANNSNITGLNIDRYVLCNYDKNSYRMDIPLNFTVTLPNSLDNFEFTSAAYARFTGVKALRPLEMLYIDNDPSST